MFQEDLASFWAEEPADIPDQEAPKGKPRFYVPDVFDIQVGALTLGPVRKRAHFLLGGEVLVCQCKPSPV